MKCYFFLPFLYHGRRVNNIPISVSQQLWWGEISRWSRHSSQKVFVEITRVSFGDDDDDDEIYIHLDTLIIDFFFARIECTFSGTFHFPTYKELFGKLVLISLSNYFYLFSTLTLSLFFRLNHVWMIYIFIYIYMFLYLFII